MFKIDFNRVFKRFSYNLTGNRLITVCHSHPTIWKSMEDLMIRLILYPEGYGSGVKLEKNWLKVTNNLILFYSHQGTT